MELTDLRIGNYYYWYAEGKNYEMKVEAKDFSNDNYKNFSPIPLTEEILLNCQAVKSQERNDLFSLYTFTIIISDGKCNIFSGGSYITTISYLHQLQNLFQAIKGIELTINF